MLLSDWSFITQSTAGDIILGLEENSSFETESEKFPAAGLTENTERFLQQKDGKMKREAAECRRAASLWQSRQPSVLFEAFVLNNLFCSDTNMLPQYLPRFHFNSAFLFWSGASHPGEMCARTHRESLKCTPASEVLC